jgi:SHS2 domain-containing protein
MKTCFKCQQEKPLSAFYTHSQTGAPHRECKACTLARQRIRRENNLEAIKADIRARHWANREKELAQKRAYMLTDAYRESQLRSSRLQRERYPQRDRAWKQMSHAMRRGLITKWPVCSVPTCSCTEVEGHHPDYSQPLSVVWLCPTHHRQLHDAVKAWARDNSAKSATF